MCPKSKAQDLFIRNEQDKKLASLSLYAEINCSGKKKGR